METKEEVPAQELPEGALEVQMSSEPEVSSTQEDLFEQSSKTGRLVDCSLLFLLIVVNVYFSSEAAV